MESRHRYRFVIAEAFTPETLPMARLAEYMADMAALLGEAANVHFVRVEAGSTVLVQDVAHEAHPKVRDRVHAIKHREATIEATRAYDALNGRLAADNATGLLLEDDNLVNHSTRVLDFPGATQQVRKIEYGPIAQTAALQGVVIVVGGENDPVPVHLQDNDAVHICRAKRDLAKELACYIFGAPLRVSGKGRWFRNADGDWSMRSFQIANYEQLQHDRLGAVVTQLREVQGAPEGRADTLEMLRALRRED